MYDGYPDLLAEMYAYSMAAAHESLPHFSMSHYMISNTFANDEGWRWIDTLQDDICLPPTQTGISDTGIPMYRYYNLQPLPNLLHYCQFFRIGEIGFHKRRIKPEIFNCDFPLMLDPPVDIGKTDYKNRDGEVSTLHLLNLFSFLFPIFSVSFHFIMIFLLLSYFLFIFSQNFYFIYLFTYLYVIIVIYFIIISFY